MVKIDSRTLAKYILIKSGPMNHLKMQKLLYYVEAFHQAYFDRGIIDDEFEAWVHGPVSRVIWNELKDLSKIYDDVYFFDEESEEDLVTSVEEDISQEQLDLVTDVIEEYGELSSYRLECLTHEEEPWLEARCGVPDGDPSNNLIRRETMRRFYKDMLYSN